jgi:hypothetical protein
VAPLLATILAGCGLVPKSRLDQCHKLSQGLQAEVVQLRDQSSKLRAQNEDLIERAQTDQRRLAGLEDIMARQESALDALRDDRERLAGELERVLRVVRAPTGDATALNERLDTFATKHPGVVHEPGSLTCALPTARLFAPGTAELTPLGRDWLRDLAALAREDGPDGAELHLSARGPDGVVRTSTDDPAANLASRAGGWLEGDGRLPQGSVVVEGPGGEDAPSGCLTVRFAPRLKRLAGLDDPK